MVLHRHLDLERASPAPGLFRIIVMDEKLGSGAITQGMVRLEPGRQTRPHTHRVEESMTLLEGRLRVLIGTEVAEVDAPATFLAPANTVHALRNVESTPAVLCIAYPSVNVGTYYVDGSSSRGNGARGAHERRGVKRIPARPSRPGSRAGTRKVLARPS
jgi:quercetin dioxygenase-like cupin family protein